MRNIQGLLCFLVQIVLCFLLPLAGSLCTECYESGFLFTSLENWSGFREAVFLGSITPMHAQKPSPLQDLASVALPQDVRIYSGISLVWCQI